MSDDLSHGPGGAAIPIPGMGARGARVVQVIEVTSYEGAGTADDVGRTVTWFYSLDGELLARRDPADGDLAYVRKYRPRDDALTADDIRRMAASISDLPYGGFMPPDFPAKTFRP